MKFASYLLAAFLFAFSAIGFAETVDINTADAETIAAVIKGVGPNKAAAIVAYREEHGPFKSIHELTAVKGIGQKTVDANADNITVGDSSAEQK